MGGRQRAASLYRSYIEAFDKDSNSKWLRGVGLSSLEKLGPFNIFRAENLKL